MGGKRASCSAVFTINGKRPTSKPSVAPPPRPRGATAAAGTKTTKAAPIRYSASAALIHYSAQCNYLYHELHSTILNETPFTIAFYEWEWDWLNGVWIDRSGAWNTLVPGGWNDKLIRVPYSTYVSMFGSFYGWDGTTWVALFNGYAGAGGSGEGGDGNGLSWCYA